MNRTALSLLIVLAACGVAYLFWPSSEGGADEALDLVRAVRPGGERSGEERAETELEAGTSTPDAAARAVVEDEARDAAPREGGGPEPGSIAGRVVDAAGQPLAGAEIWLSRARERRPRVLGPPLATTGADGAFAAPLPPMAGWLVWADADGYGRQFQGVFDGSSAHSGVEFVLGEGAQLRGRVVWSASERPAAGAEVVAYARVSRIDAQGERPQRAELTGIAEVGHATAGADGSFFVRGVIGHAVTLRAVATDADGARWAARDDHPDDAEVVLRLGPATRVHVTAVDDLGAPLDGKGRFVITPVLEEAIAWEHPLARVIDFDLDAQGRQVFEDVEPGTWIIDARKGFYAGDRQRLVLPADPAQLSFVLKRPGSIEGRVLDSGGAPIPGAAVEVEERAAEAVPKSEPDGRFVVAAVQPGAGMLTTEVNGVEVELEFEVSPGERLTGVDLVLPAGAYVSGVFLDQDGVAVPNSEVLLLTADEEGEKATTDASGAFRLGPLPPGPYQLLGVLHREFDGIPVEEILQNLVTTKIDLVAGETLDVVLRAEQREPCEITGRVTVGGAPALDCTVVCSREGDSLVEGLQITETNDEGRYSVIVDRPGRYVFLFQPDERESPGTPRPLTVPACESFVFDVELPAHGIAGTLVRDGVGVRGRVDVRPLDLDSPFPDSESDYKTDDEGRFDVRFLDPGRYVVRGAGAGLSSKPLEVVVGARGVRDLQVPLEAPCVLGGVVRDVNGQPLAGAHVFVQTPTGRRVNLNDERSRAAGRFGVLVPAGTYLVSARAAGHASARREVSVTFDEETSVELDLAPGALLRVRALDDEGRPVTATFRAFDGDGVEVSDLAVGQAETGAFGSSTRTSEQLFGPLPPGRYELRVQAADGRSARDSVSLKAGPESVVDVEL